MAHATPPSRAPTARRALTFVDGLGTGITVSAVIAVVYMQLHADGFADMYRDLGGRLPLLTRVVLHPAWTFAAPLGIVLLASAALVARQRFRLAMIAIAALALLTVAVTYAGTYQPMWALAGNIK